jgi:cystathionine gamma-synthase
MAAAMAVVQSLKPGDHIVAPKVMYWGLRNWLLKFCDHWGLGLDLFDAVDPDALKNTVRKGKTKLVWIETPCNPTWDVIDIAAAAEIAHAAGAWLAADSTVSTPVLTQPIKHGADIVMHSITKYIGGHSDVVAGALMFNDSDLYDKLFFNLKTMGTCISPFDAWIALRGSKTL